MKRTGPAIAAIGFFLFAQAALADWTPAKRLTWNPGSSESPAIAVDSSGHIHVIWEDEAPGNYEIFYRKSTDGGDTWSANRRLTWTPERSSSPAIIADAFGNLHVVWQDLTPGNYEFFHRKSTDGGTTWTAAKRITWTSGPSFLPALAADPAGNLYLVWEDNTPGNYEIYFKGSSNGGDTWTPSRRLTWTLEDSLVPAIAAGPADKAHLVWGDETPGDFEVFYRKSTDGGASWSAKERLTYTETASVRPAIDVVAPDKIFVVWEDSLPGMSEIYFKKSTDGGTTWRPAKRLTWTSGYSSFAALAADSSGNIRVVWQDATPGNDELFTKMSADGGATWTPDKRLSWTSGNSRFLAFAFDSFGNAHVVWQDDTPGNWDIYYLNGK